MQIDLLKPDKPSLITKWGHIVAAVSHLNKWDTPEEIAWLCELASISESHLEFGAYNGGSTKAMMLANPSLKITTVDLWDDAGTRDLFRSALSKEIEEGRVIDHHCSTEEAAAKLEGQTFQTCFIDAAHTFAEVRKDIENCLKLIPKGFISGHDYRHDIPDDGVNRAVNELLNPVHFPVDSIWCYLNGKGRKGFYA